MDWGNLPFHLQLLVFESAQEVLSSEADSAWSFPLRLLSYTPAAWVLLCFFYLASTMAYTAARSKRIKLPAAGDAECSGLLQRLRQLVGVFEVFIREEDILEVELDAEGTDEVLSSVDLEALLPPQPIALRLLPLVEALGWLGWSAWLAFPAAGSKGKVLELLLLPVLTSISWALVFLKEFLRQSRLPPYELLSFLLLQSLSSGVTLAQSLHQHSSTSHRSLQALLLAASRVPDLVCCISLVVVVLAMPSRAPLGSVIRDKARNRADPRPASLEDSNTLLGSLTYSWMGSIMSLARTRPLLPSDVWALSLTNRAEVLSRRFSSLREKTLLGRMLHASARDIAIDFSLKLVAVSLNYLRPYWIQRILESLALSAPSLSNPAPWTPRQQAYIFALLAFASMVLFSLAQLQHFHYARRIGMRLRSELTVAVFEKALRRKDMRGRTQGSASTGRVVSLVSEDTNQILRMGCDSHLIYGAPLEISLALLFLYNLMGWSSLVGFAILVFAAPVNYFLGKQSIQITRARSAARDDRQALLQELISSIRTVKFFGWSDAWIEKTEDKRAIELNWVVREWLNRFYLTALWALISLVVPLASFFFFVKIQQKELTVAIAFTALALFSMVRGPLNQIPEFGIRILQTQVSIARIESFFHEEEVASHAQPSTRQRSTLNLAFHRASLAWHSSGPECRLALQDIDITFPRGLTLVSGPTGSGKTSLLLALLGELEVVSGSVDDLPPAVSYAAQHPWLESVSIRANILFGTPYDRERYQATISACALPPDLATLPDGDSTHIGERGVSLSGGQKARIALARAIYAPTICLLLDDVLSAVDSHTARHILDHALGGPLLEGRTCVLVTHHVELVLPRASYRVDLCDGKVIFQGPVSGMGDSTAAEKGSQSEVPGSEEEETVAKAGEVAGTVAEGWTTGEVKTSVFARYLEASYSVLWVILLALILARPPLSFLEQFWLRLWGEDTDSKKKMDYYLQGYALIGTASVLVLLLSTAVLYAASLRASKTIFSELLQRVVRCPPRWFDVTPQGRITNRFTNDIAMVDEALAGNFSNFAIHLSGMAAALVVTTVILPAAFVPTACFALVYAVYFVRYLAVNRDLNRIAATTASPIFSGFQEVLVGITTIRAYAKETAYRANLCTLIDETLALWYASCTLDVWLSIRTQLLSASCLLGTASFAIFMRTSPGLSGIAITSSTAIISSLDWLCNAYGRLVMGLNSMERISEYLELQPESSGGIIPPATWPSSGAAGPLIDVRDLVIKYSPELAPVLHGISFSVLPRERIAIAGRTGSGKSTLAMSFLRFVNPAEGQIIIDSLDITTVALEDLRRRITFLPQESVLFSGSVRDNLDPFHLHSDEECLDALRRVHLSSSGSGTRTPVALELLDEVDDSRDVTGGSVSLATEVSGGGSNFSAGQRQLLALARALLRVSSIIIFDESTAAIDFRLDAMIQATIRTEFQDACLITIAHRLRTIADYDKVLVLEGGRVLEFDTPVALLERDSAFSEMCRQSGDYEELVAIARNTKS